MELISGDRLQELSEEYCYLEGEISHLIRLLQHIRSFQEDAPFSLLSFGREIDEQVSLKLLRLLGAKSPVLLKVA